MKVRDIIDIFEELAPFSYQESYDNSGLQVGEKNAEVHGILITLDITEEVLEETIQSGCNLLLSHHPLIFNGIKSITGENTVERIIARALREKINILSVHTNIDNSGSGVNKKICEKLELQDTSVLLPAEGKLLKLSVFVPEDHAHEIRECIFNAGAGVIGNYDSCSFNIQGTGTFRGNEKTDPFVGEKGKLHYGKEVRIETILPAYLKEKVIREMLEAHPYEEVAYDLYPVENKYNRFGSGMVGILPEKMSGEDFLLHLKKTFMSSCIRHSLLSGRNIKKVAVCGGSGSFLIKDAINSGADAFISGDIKYHQFFDTGGNILLADIGHYESEQFTKELFYELIIKKFPNFALHLSKINTNPIHYI